MEDLAVGSIVITLFPFSNLKGHKLRPALVLANAEFDNFILCQITSKSYTSKLAVKLTEKDFAKGSLPISSYIRPDKLFTADSSIILKVAGQLSLSKQRSILQIMQNIFKV